MLVELQLDTDRFSPKDKGFVLDLTGDEAWDLVENDQNCVLEPNSRYVILDPIRDFLCEEKTDFTLSDAANWEELADVTWFTGRALHHRSIVNTTATYTAALEKNQATIIGLALARPIDDAPIVLKWGIVSGVAQITLTLEVGKRPKVEILDISQSVPYPTMTFELPDVLDAKTLFAQPIRIVCLPLRQRLLIYSDLWGDWWMSPAWETKPSWSYPPPPDPPATHYYCLRAGQFSVNFQGIGYLSFRPMSYQATGQFDIPFELPYTPTELPTSAIDWEVFSGCGAMLALYRPNGDPYELGDTEGYARVSLTGPATRTPIVNKIKVIWPPTAEFVEGNPVAPDLIEAEEILSADPGADSWRFVIRPGPGEAELWHRPNLPFLVTVDGDTPRMVGSCDTPTRRESAADGANQTYEIKLRSGLKRLEHALLVRAAPNAGNDGMAFDGMPLDDVITWLLQLAGADDSEIHVSANATGLPQAEDGKPPLYKFDGGVSVKRAIEQLRDEWATDWLFGHLPDGFHFAAPPDPGTPSFTFLRGEDPGGDPDQYVGELEIWSDDSEFINYLVVWGQDDEGNPIRSDEIKDQPSVDDPEADDYVGDWRECIVINSSINTVAKANIVANKIWSVGNHLPRFVRFQAHFQKTLRPWSVVEVEYSAGETPTYLTVRLLEMRTRFLPNLALTDYSGEILS